MKRAGPKTFQSTLARISIWTIVHHRFLVGRIRIYIWSASATILFLSIARIIPLHTALTTLLFCGCAMLILLWCLINWRKAILLDIDDPALKRTAHAAMLALIKSKECDGATLKNRTAWRHRCPP